MDTTDEIAEVASKVAAAIARRDTVALRALVAPGFVHRSHGGERSDTDAFMTGVEQIPGEIKFVRLEQLTIDVFGTSAAATGVQRAQVVVDGQVIDDARRFVDWFVQQDGEWRIQAAVDFE